MNTKNIGEIIKSAWQKSGMSQKEFADEMDMSVRNLQYLFEKTDIHISQIAKASSVLKKDFIKDFLEILEKKEGINFPSDYNSDKLVMEEMITKYLPEKVKQKDEITVQLNIKGDITLVSKYFPEMLDIVKREANTRGLKIV